MTNTECDNKNPSIKVIRSEEHDIDVEEEE